MAQRKKNGLNKRFSLERDARQNQVEPPPKIVIDKRVLELRKMPYHEYLRTDHWAKKRHDALVYYGWMCLCGRQKYLQVHHRSYTNIGCEPLNELSVLCDRCHKRTHNTGEIPLLRRRKRKAKRARVPLKDKERTSDKPIPPASVLVEKMLEQQSRRPK